MKGKKNLPRARAAAAIHSLAGPAVLDSQQNIFMGTLPLWRLPTLLMMMGEVYDIYAC